MPNKTLTAARTTATAHMFRVPAGKVRPGMMVSTSDKTYLVEDVVRVYVGAGRGLQGRDLYLYPDRVLRRHHAALVDVLWYPPLALPQDAKF